MTFNAKNLIYHTHEPVFLQRLRQEHQGSSRDMNKPPVNDRHKHMRQSAEDNQPTYVMEGDGETVSKADFDRLISQSDNETPNAGNSVNKGKEAERRALQGSLLTTPCDAAKSHTTVIGARTRKRQIKAVNESADLSRDQNPDKNPQTPIKVKKSKKVKLSFENID